jgi:uncharacterized Zn finger protein
MAKQKSSIAPQQINIQDLLKTRSREDLVQIIGKMLEKSPDLIWLVDLPQPPVSQKLTDLSAYQRQIDRALGLGKMKDIVKALEPIVAIAAELLKKNNWSQAGQLYHLLLEASIDRYNGVLMDIDYNGEVACIIQDISEGLANCLEQAATADEQTRDLWLRTLVNGVFKDIDMGGTDFAYGAWDGVVKSANKQEWLWIEVLLRQKLAKTRKDSWSQGRLVEMLIDQQEAVDQGQSAQAIIADLGSPEQKVDLLMQQQRWDEAIAIAQDEFVNLPGLVSRFADSLLAVNQPAKALAYILEEQKRAQRSWHYDDWLAKYYDLHGDSEMALQLSIGMMRSRPNLQQYLKLKSLAGEQQGWKKLQQEILTNLDCRQHLELLIDVLLAEKDFEKALQFLLKVNTNHQVVTIRVAQAMESTQPMQAIALYKPLVTELIQCKHRGAYKDAVVHLQKIRNLYDGDSAWRSYIQELRNTYPTLKALQQELNYANL